VVRTTDAPVVRPVCNMCKPKSLEIFLQAAMPRTLLPRSSSLGENTAIPN